MQFSQQGIDFLKRRESLKLTAYKDSAGVWTIGYGTIRINGRPVLPGDTCTQEQAEEYLWDELHGTIETVDKAVASVTVTQNQFDSLVSFAYNVGNGGLLTSTLLKAIQARTPVIADFFLRWNKVRDPKTGQLVVSQGLTNRRMMEWQMYSLGVYL